MTDEQYNELIKIMNSELLSGINQQLTVFIAKGMFLDSNLNSSESYLQHGELKEEKNILRAQLLEYITKNKKNISDKLQNEIIKNF